MSLVIAFVWITGAIISADVRQITFQGEKVAERYLKQELYNRIIITNEDLDNETLNM